MTQPDSADRPTPPRMPFAPPGGTPGSDDPDAADLPPGIQLPSEAAFRKGQLWARLVVAMVTLVVLGGFLIWMPDDRPIVGLCMGLVAAVVVILFFRYKNAVRQEQEDSHKP